MFTRFNHLVCFIYKAQTQQQSPQGAHRLTHIQQTAANSHVTLAEHRYGADGADGAALKWDFSVRCGKMNERRISALQTWKYQSGLKKLRRVTSSESLPRLFVGQKVLTAPKRLVWFANHWKKFIIFFERWIFLSSLKNIFPKTHESRCKCDLSRAAAPLSWQALLGF